MTLKVLDLFSGIGGFSLGLERSGMETVAFCEIEEYPRSILKKHWPDVPVYEDVRKLKGDQLGTVDVICGGFPCQPFSVAGKQRGKEDDRHLWPEMFRLLQETRPTWLIGENVAGFITMALDDVLSDLESEGYACQSFVIPACAVGGIHRRDRVWIVAHSESLRSEFAPIKGTSEGQRTKPREGGQPNVMANSNNSKKKRQQRISDEILQEQKTDRFNETSIRESDTGFKPIELPTEPTVRNRNDGLSNNVARLKALGNAVVPQIPELIGRAIMEIENEYLHD